MTTAGGFRAAAGDGSDAPSGGWAEAPVRNTLALAVLAVTAVYFVLVPTAALFVFATLALMLGIAVFAAAVVAAVGLAVAGIDARRAQAGAGPVD